MCDELIMSRSNEDVSHPFLFQNKQLYYINDSNTGSYSSNQVTFDLANFANNSKFLNWQESYLAIPLVLTVNGVNTTDTANTCFPASLAGAQENAFVASLKNGSYQLIHSMSVKLANNEVVPIQPFSNLAINYNILSSWNSNDIAKKGPSLHFDKDTAESAYFDATQGSTNNSIYQAFAPNQGYKFANNGRLRRMYKTSFFQNDGQLNAVIGTARPCDTIYKDCCFPTGTGYGTASANNDATITYHILATIRMAEIHDFFNKCPLMRNAYYSMIFNLNTNVTVTETFASSNTTTTVLSPATSVVVSPNGVVPFMLSPVNVIGGTQSGTGRTVVAAAAKTYTITTNLAIAKSGLSGIDHPLKTCRIYASMVDLTPDAEAIYVASENKVKAVKYMDFMTFYSGGDLTNIATNTAVNKNLNTSGLARLRKIVIYPMINSAANGTLALAPMNSPYASEPATCSPYCYVNNLNITVSGKVVFEQNEQYSFENYLAEVSRDNCINGGLSPGLSSGIINQNEHDSAYGFIVVDLSRHNVSADNVGQQIGIQFTNCGQLACDYYIQIFYEKEVLLDIDAGVMVI